MSSTPKRFTRYDAEHHDPATRYVLADEVEQRVHALRLWFEKTEWARRELPGEYLGTHIADALSDWTQKLRTERNALARLRDELLRDLELERLRHAATRAELASAPSYPVENPANPLLTVESGGIRYVLEVRSDEDGDWFEVKSATPTEPQTLADFTHSARPERRAHIEAKASHALAAYRAEQREDDEASRAH